MKLRYPAGRQAFGEARINWPKGAIVAYLVSEEYHASDKHRGVGDLRGVVAGPIDVEKRTIVDGYAKASPMKFQRVRADRKAVAVVISEKNGTLIAYSDEVRNFPVQPNGGDIDVKFDPHIFRL